VARYHFNAQNEFILSAGYLYSRSKRTSLLTNELTGLSSIYGKNTYNGWGAKAEYNYSPASRWSVSAGVHFSSIVSDGHSDYIYEADGTPLYNDKSHVRDIKLSVYGMVSRRIGNFYINAGLRGETFLSRYSLVDSVNYHDNQFKVFPNLTCQWTVSPSVTLIGAFNIRNQRASFNDLSPLISYKNPYLYEQGNPALKSNDSYTYSLSFVLQNKFVIQARYIYSRNAVLWAFEEDSRFGDALVNRPSNINYPLWLFNSSYSDKFSFYRFAYNAMLEYIPHKISYIEGYAPRSPKLFVSTVNQFDITKTTLFSVDFSYTSRTSYLGVTAYPKYSLSCWIRQTFLGNRLHLIVRGNDLLHRTASRTENRVSKVMSVGISDPDSRQLSVSLIYNFNGFKKEFTRTSNNSENQERISQ